MTAAATVLIVHNQYQLRGGEDTVFQAERLMLEGHGFNVKTLNVSNHSITGAWSQMKVAVQTPYSLTGRRLMGDAIKTMKPDVVHVHNTFPMLSPSIFYECAAAGVPVVYTLHNFRTLCASGFFLRDGKVCEDCLDGSVLNGIVHKCYRSSYVASLAVCSGIAMHKFAGTWRDKVSKFIVLSEFAKKKFQSGGIPSEKIVVKPNFVRRPTTLPEPANRQGAVFVGRLSAEKGVNILIEAWKDIDVPLVIVGTGPEEEALRHLARGNDAISFAGFQAPEEVATLLSRSEVAIIPSVWNEMFGMTVVEAMAYGLPVIASKIGSLVDMISHGQDGLHFEPGVSTSLRQRVLEFFAPDFCREEMASNARKKYEMSYSEEENLRLLVEIYSSVMLGSINSNEAQTRGVDASNGRAS